MIKLKDILPEAKILVYKINDKNVQKFLKKYPKVEKSMKPFLKGDILNGYKKWIRWKDKNEDKLGGKPNKVDSKTFGSKVFWKHDWNGVSGWAEVFQYLHKLGEGKLNEKSPWKGYKKHAVHGKAEVDFLNLISDFPDWKKYNKLTDKGKNIIFFTKKDKEPLVWQVSNGREVQATNLKGDESSYKSYRLGDVYKILIEGASSSTMNKLKRADMTQDIEDILDNYEIDKKYYKLIDVLMMDIRDEEDGMKPRGHSDGSRKELMKVLKKAIKEGKLNEGDKSLAYFQHIGYDIFDSIHKLDNEMKRHSVAKKSGKIKKIIKGFY